MGVGERGPEELRRCLKSSAGTMSNAASPEDGIVSSGGIGGAAQGVPHHQQHQSGFSSSGFANNGVRLRCPGAISRLKVEKIEGGLMVAGVVVAANCQIALPVFGFLFLLVGIVLTAISYREPRDDEEEEEYANRIAGDSRIIGPVCILVGGLMLALGVLLCVLTRRARRDARRVGFHCPIHGDFYPASPVLPKQMLLTKENRWWRRIPGLRGSSSDPSSNKDNTPLDARVGLPQCPHSMLSSTRSSISSAPLSPCPQPMPFLVTSGTMSGMIQASAGTNLSPDQTFGSIRSLSVSREIASFPLSRTPSPPRRHRPLPESRLIEECGISESLSNFEPSPKPEIRLMAPIHRTASNPVSSKTTKTSAASEPTRKTVSIILPEDKPD